MSAARIRVKHLFSQSMLSTLQAIMVFIAALFTTALLPSLIVRYFYAEQDLFAPPAVVELVPVISFALSGLYFVYVVGANIRRSMIIAKLQKQIELDAANCGDGCCGAGCCEPGDSSSPIDMSELKELEEMVDAALESRSTGKSKKTTKSKKVSKSK